MNTRFQRGNSIWEKPPIATSYYFHSSKVSTKMLGVTLLKDLITLLGVALLEVLKQFNRIATLLEDLQMVV